jgi:tRNA(Glu) U13 pseudouridine synthase TruD
MQRFGSSAIGTHSIGLAILKVCRMREMKPEP